MSDVSGILMSEDIPVAEIKSGKITAIYNENLLPLYFKRSKNIEGWLSARAIDSHRVNSRLLKKALRLSQTDDIQTVLSVNAATVTDCYWFKPDGDNTVYENIKFKENYFDQLALRGDPDGFSQKPSRTPELTNIGSYEKCWKLINGEWWLYKSGSKEEYFSELFICRLGEKLGLNMAHYEMDGNYIRTKDFTGGNVNFEPASSVVGADDDYCRCFSAINSLSPEFARQYLVMIWFDTICYNMDRHTENFGFIRDKKTGKIISLAPNYDNNVALIARGYPSDVTRQNDGLIGFLKSFVENSKSALEMYREISLPTITRQTVEKCINEIPIDVNCQYICDFILNGQEKVNAIINGDMQETEEIGFTQSM